MFSCSIENKNERKKRSWEPFQVCLFFFWFFFFHSFLPFVLFFLLQVFLFRFRKRAAKVAQKETRLLRVYTGVGEYTHTSTCSRYIDVRKNFIFIIQKPSPCLDSYSSREALFPALHFRVNRTGMRIA